ncbi:MAG: metallophosphoesterase, partial [Lachnospiraceae bacterium]|nr:metallophosphoesterase [Lachnospiraceae bacterium]
MLMWTLIVAAVMGAFAAGYIYILSRIAKIEIVRKISSGKKSIGFLIGLAIIIPVMAVLYFMLGMINAIMCVLHLFVFWMLCDLAVYFIFKRRDRHYKEYYACVAAVTITVVYLAAGWYMAHHVAVTYYTLDTDKQVGSFRIIQFADSHIGTTFDGKGLYQYVKQMNELKPDVVLITGDYVDDDTSKEDMIDACSALGELQTSFGVYFAFGNHDKGYYGS